MVKSIGFAHPAVMLVGFGAMLLVALLAPLPHMSWRGVSAIQDMSHIPAFACLAALGCWTFLRCGVSHLAAGVLVGSSSLLVAWASEWGQGLVGRSNSPHDLLADGAGVGIGLILFFSFSLRRWVRSSLLASVLLVSIASVQPAGLFLDSCRQTWAIPVIASFESHLERTRLIWQDCGVERVQDHVTDGDWALEITLGQAKYPGVSMDCQAGDWSQFASLTMDIWAERPVSLRVKIYDTAHTMETSDRFNRRFDLISGMNQLRISLSNVRRSPRDREMDLTDVSCLQLFTVNQSEPIRLVVDNIRLRDPD